MKPAGTPPPDGLRSLPVGEWNEGLEKVVSDMRGQPLNVHGLMAHNPDLLAAWWSLRLHVVRGGQLSARHRELVVLRVAAHTACWYEWASHVERGLAAGLTLQEVEAVTWASAPADWVESDALVLRAVDDCAAFGRILPETLEALRDRLSAVQVLDIIAVHGTYMMLATMIDTWSLELDESVPTPPGYCRETWSPDPLGTDR